MVTWPQLSSVCLCLEENYTELTHRFCTFLEEGSSNGLWRNTKCHSHANGEDTILFSQGGGFWTSTKLKRKKPMWTLTANLLEKLLGAFVFPQWHLTLRANWVILDGIGLLARSWKLKARFSTTAMKSKSFLQAVKFLQLLPSSIFQLRHKLV